MARAAYLDDWMQCNTTDTHQIPCMMTLCVFGDTHVRRCVEHTKQHTTSMT